MPPRTKNDAKRQGQPQAPRKPFQFTALRMNAGNMPMPPNQVVVKTPHWYSSQRLCKKKSTKTAAKKKKDTKNLARRTKSERK
ncbi:predicted protein [Chaetoceros tenuissimus]|uniref:Uncharacterized protein n=1 Tax=Chaetoceros tenuissimus TaxID=426638 RepID=A0AAD3D2F0_9STRA|nr:predicted protein [Chaetoceros tenuissimus]